jgi:flagellar P-ring protein precursor FlgI
MRFWLVIGIAFNILLASAAQASMRIKDIVSVEGIRENPLVGYGLVVGLNGTGDNLNNTPFTKKGLTDFLERLGVSTLGSKLQTKNVAAVTVTALLPAFARQGARIDVTVSTLGDAKSLENGTLLATPILGADGHVYAVAQGAISTGGYKATAGATSVSKNVTTNATIVGGAIVEREVDFALSSLETIKLALHNPDVSTALYIADMINYSIGSDIARAIDPGTVQMTIPEFERDDIVAMLSRIEKLEVDVDQPAKILIDEGSGTVVMGSNVRISPVAVSQGNLNIAINEVAQVNQPGVLAPEGAQTIVVKNAEIKVTEPGMRMATLETGATLGELVSGLNALGVGPRDLITILRAIKSAGALQATIEVR